MPYIIAEPCINVKDRSCVDVCPVDCIYEGEDMLYIHPDECIDCGACEPECPVTAIFPEEDCPPQWKSFIAKNRDVFNGPNPPGKPQRKGAYSRSRNSTRIRVAASGCSSGARCAAAGTRSSRAPEMAATIASIAGGGEIRSSSPTRASVGTRTMASVGRESGRSRRARSAPTIPGT